MRFRQGVAVAAVFVLVNGLSTAVALPTKPGPLPDSTRTPGAISEKVTQENIGQTICVSGYTKTVRKVSAKTKAKVYAAYKVPKKDRSKYTIDHLIPLSLGGNNSTKNLWPEPEKGSKNATSKDGVERGLRTLVCNGTVPLNTAQTAIATDWTTALVTVTPTPPPPPPSPPPAPRVSCDPNYSGRCVPPYPPDVDCADVGGSVQVVGSDPHGLDADRDGFGCE
jgi:hypothetical protein